MNFFEVFFSLFFVFNAIGYIPVFLAVLAPYDQKRQQKIIIRESLIALFVILLFIFFGSAVLNSIGIDKSTIGMAGGLLLLLISLTLLFPKENSSQEPSKQFRHEPFIVPLAIPGLAGPGTMTTAMLFADKFGSVKVAFAFLAVWIVSFIALYSSSYLKKYLGEKGLHAIEKLGGMLIILIAVKMFSTGVMELIESEFYTPVKPKASAVSLKVTPTKAIAPKTEAAKAENQSEIKTEVQPLVEPVKIEPLVQPEVKAEVVIKPEIKTENAPQKETIKIEPQVQPEPKAEVVIKSEVKTEVAPQKEASKVESIVQPEVKTDVAIKPEVSSQKEAAKVESQAQPELKAEVVVKSEIKTEVAPPKETTSISQPEIKPEVVLQK